MDKRSISRCTPPMRWLLAIAAVLVAGTFSPVTLARQAPPKSDALDVIQIRSNLYAIFGAGGNIGVQIGPQGVILVDAGTAGQADEVIAAVKRLTPRPIRFIISTSPDANHVGGNETVAQAGQAVHSDDQLINIGGAFGRGEDAGRRLPAVIIAAEALFLRAMASTGLPLEAYPGKRRTLFLNEEGIEVLHQPAAHSDGDSFVIFRRSDVVFAGDVVDFTRFPDVDVAKGGSIQGEIDALNRLIEITIPALPLHWLSGGTIVVPGHGRIAEENDVVEYRDMVVIVRDRVKDLLDKGQTLPQIIAANPTHGWDQYGSTPAESQRFVSAIYESLKGTR